MKKFLPKKETIIKYLKDPKLFLSFLIAWMITNGWSYILLGLGVFLKIKWMQVVATGYLAILWLPCTPEKLITIPLSVFFYKLFTKRKRMNNEENDDSYRQE
jgi:hypothetical protein